MKLGSKKVLIPWMLFYLICICGCGSRNALTTDAFSQIMEEKDFTVLDVTEHIKVDYVESVRLAIAEDYQIEFYTFTNKDAAASVWEQNRSVFEEKADEASVRVTKNIANYSFFSLDSAGLYRMVARIDNTMLYVVADERHKAEITALIKELGY